MHDGKFGFLRGRFEDEARKIFTARVVFSAKGKLSDGNVASFESEQEIRWRLGAGGTIPSRKNDYLMIPDEWQVSDWLVKEAKLTTAGAQPFFVEVTDQAIPDEGDPNMYSAMSSLSRIIIWHASYEGSSIYDCISMPLTAYST